MSILAVPAEKSQGKFPEIRRKRAHLPLLVLLLALLLPGASARAEGAAVTLRALPAGEAGGYNVSVFAEGLEDIAMMQFSLCYDPAVLRCTGCSAGGAFAGNLAPLVNAETDGAILFLWDSLTPFAGEGELLVLHMEMLSDQPAEMRFDDGRTLVFAYDDYSAPAVMLTGCILGAPDAARPETVASASDAPSAPAPAPGTAAPDPSPMLPSAPTVEAAPEDEGEQIPLPTLYFEHAEPVYYTGSPAANNAARLRGWVIGGCALLLLLAVLLLAAGTWRKKKK